MGVKKAILIGLIIGIILAVANGFTLGFIGFAVITILFNPFRFIFKPLMMGCSGEGCWGPMILVDGLVFILVSMIISLLIYLSYKHFIKKENSEKTKYVIIFDIIIIGLILFSVFIYAREVCYSNEGCIVTLSKITGPDWACEHSSSSTRFVFDPQNYPGSYNSWSLGLGGCYSKLALIQKDESLCQKSSNKREQDDCYAQLSRVKPDITLCQKIHVGEYDENDVATSGMNSFAQWDRDYCYKNIAVLNNDISKCDMIQNNDNKQLCLAILKNDKSYCGQISKGMFMLSQSAILECENHFV